MGWVRGKGDSARPVNPHEHLALSTTNHSCALPMKIALLALYITYAQSLKLSDFKCFNF